MTRRNIWIAIYAAAAVIFFAGFFLDIQTSPYFPAFVAFCMIYGAATSIYWWRTHGH